MAQSEEPIVELPREEPAREDQLASLEATFCKLLRALQPCQPVLSFAAGAVSCFYGRHFTYSASFWHAFQELCWPALRRAALELRLRLRNAHCAARREGLPSFEEASSTAGQVLGRLQTAYAAYGAAQSSGDAEAVQRLAAEVQSLQSDLERARRAGGALSAVSAELEPETLLQLARSVHSGLLASLKAGIEENTSVLGLPIDVGDNIATSVNEYTAPLLHSLWGSAAQRLEVQELAEDQWVQRLLGYAVRCVSNSVGIAVASYAEALAFMLANARLGAQAMVRQLLPGGWPLAEVGLAAAGLYWQLLSGLGLLGCLWRLRPGGASLPGALKLALAGPLLVEGGLKATVVAMRAGILE